MLGCKALRIDIDVQCIYIDKSQGILGQENAIDGMWGYVAMIGRVLQLRTVDQDMRPNLIWLSKSR